MKPMVSIVTVLHNSDTVLPTYELNFSVGYDPESIRFVLVDNASDKLPEVERWTIRPTIIQSENNGFGAGCNLGWKSVNTEWVGFVNPDVEMTSTQAIELVELASRVGGVDVIAPFVSEDDSFSRAMGPPWRTRRYRVGESIDGIQYLTSAASVSGCCIFVRRSSLIAIGGFDERFFMYCEENDLQKRLLDNGARIAVARNIKVYHAAGVGSSNQSLDRNIEREKSKRLYYLKHFSLTEYYFMRLITRIRAATIGRLLTGGWSAMRKKASLDIKRAD
ncbi:glycosyltransferase family 2 protein [Mycolicibacterium monacense]|uniref:Glycosyltransferase 2-like domain-containing protein n=1 Tax=Mycolicibacterium monacense TaxID=85693 RepID=A0AAD1IZC8_MYCMB|nr:glycosyltransferase family 2 protein [Mycolicibacterium monacense]ORB21457.1 hypothetical protein BST34_10255 [Mycolicibacterium monacense DSM 44395]QHP84775.1 glycosyltransferase family 2 protein [Mycolicibacterium monacense DSM 44395]BBZ62420.1 hypothetical protein MMON_37210 [Mycolicibacterium monacense]